MAIENVRAQLVAAEEHVVAATKSGRATTSNNDSAGLRSSGLKTWTESTLESAQRGYEQARDALQIIRMIQGQTDHPEPPQIAQYIDQAVVHFEAVMGNCKSIIHHIEQIDASILANAVAKPAGYLHLATAIIERYKARL